MFAVLAVGGLELGVFANFGSLDLKFVPGTFVCLLWAGKLNFGIFG